MARKNHVVRFKYMITLATLRAVISGMPDDTKIGIDDDGASLVFREPESRGEELLLESGKLDAYGAYLGED